MGTGERFQLHSAEVSGKLFYYAAGFAQVFGEELNEAEKNICTHTQLSSPALPVAAELLSLFCRSRRSGREGGGGCSWSSR